MPDFSLRRHAKCPCLTTNVKAFLHRWERNHWKKSGHQALVWPRPLGGQLEVYHLPHITGSRRQWRSEHRRRKYESCFLISALWFCFSFFFFFFTGSTLLLSYVAGFTIMTVQALWISIYQPSFFCNQCICFVPIFSSIASLLLFCSSLNFTEPRQNLCTE